MKVRVAVAVVDPKKTLTREEILDFFKSELSKAGIWEYDVEIEGLEAHCLLHPKQFWVVANLVEDSGEFSREEVVGMFQRTVLQIQSPGSPIYVSTMEVLK